MRVALEEPTGRLERHSSQRRLGEGRRGLFGRAVDAQWTNEVVTHLVHGVHRREGVLQDQLDLRGVAERALRLDRNGRALEDEVAGRRRDDARQHARQHRLSRAALTHDGHDLPATRSRLTSSTARTMRFALRTRPGARTVKCRVRWCASSWIGVCCHVVHRATSFTGSSLGTRLSSTGTATPTSPTCSQHATDRPEPLICTSGGVSAEHLAMA